MQIQSYLSFLSSGLFKIVSVSLPHLSGRGCKRPRPARARSGSSKCVSVFFSFLFFFEVCWRARTLSVLTTWRTHAPGYTHYFHNDNSPDLLVSMGQNAVNTSWWWTHIISAKRRTHARAHTHRQREREKLSIAFHSVWAAHTKPYFSP